VVLTHGEHESYRRVVADLLEQGVAAEAICIVHNPVRPEDRHVQAPPGAHVLRMSGNVGYAPAMNAGMRHHLACGADWVWLLTHDIRLHPGAAQAMLAAAEHGTYGALGPRLQQAGTDLVFSLGGARTRFGWPFNVGFGGRMNRVGAKPGAVDTCAWVDGSSIMLRSEALAGVGLYDESLFIYAEDAFMCLRLERAGWETGVVQAAVAEQVAGSESRPGSVAFLIARNGLRYALAAAGPPGVVAALLRYLRETIQLVRLAVNGPQRRVSLIRCYAMWVGALAFFAGRTGPPPRWLPGQGELRGG
jgi:GT2 family glycosyltransferase